MLESAVEKKLREAVKDLGGVSYKFVSPGNDGVPDRIVVHKGRVIFVELKTDTGQLAPIQQVQIRKLRKHGADVRILFGAPDVTHLIEELKTYGV